MPTEMPVTAPAAPALVPPRRRPVLATVVRTAQISPNVRRVALVGDLDAFAATQPGAHCKLFLPAAPGTPVVLPSFGPDGPNFPADAPRPTVRTYTPRRYDVVGRELDIDLALHGEGVATRWARTVWPGERVGVAGPGRGWEPDPDASWFVLAGDETAMAALAGIAAALPETARACVVVEVPHADDAQAIGSRADLEVTWLARDGQPAGARLESHLRGLDLPAGDGRVWVAAEASLVRRVRDDLLATTGIDRDHITVRGYWKQGAVNHPDHDYGG